MTISLALLKFEGKEGPTFFIIKHDHYLQDTNEEKQSHQRYFFEEHSCPTNWLPECIMVCQDGNTDPHGFLEFVRAIDIPTDFDTYDDNAIASLFPEMFEKPEVEAQSADKGR